MKKMLNFLTHQHLLELNEKVISDYEKVYEENNNSILKFEEPITDDIKIIPFKEPNLVQLEALEEMPNELSTDIDVIKNSKYAKKIWIVEKDE